MTNKPGSTPYEWITFVQQIWWFFLYLSQKSRINILQEDWPKAWAFKIVQISFLSLWFLIYWSKKIGQIIIWIKLSEPKSIEKIVWTLFVSIHTGWFISNAGYLKNPKSLIRCWAWFVCHNKIFLHISSKI